MYWVIHTCLGFVDGISNFGNVIRKNNAVKRMGYVVSVALIALCLMFIFPVYFELDNTKAAPGDPSPVTLDYVSISDTMSARVAPSDAAGTAAKSSANDKASFSISTNNTTGYTLNIKVGDGESDAELEHDIVSMKSISSILENGVDYDVFASSSSFNNTWGIIPSSYFSDNMNNNNNADKIFPVTASGITMAVTNEANMAAANTYSIGLGLKVDYGTLAGDYTNSTIIAEYVANPVSYSIYYYANTEDEVTGMPELNPQSGLVMLDVDPMVTLAAAPEREGYMFVGWCVGDDDSTSNITVEDEKDVCGSTMFEAGGEFGISDLFDYYLYAMWWPETVRIRYNSGDLYYNDDPTDNVNEVTYLYVPTPGTETITRYSHTPNINDSGVSSGSYSNNMSAKDVVTIPGVSHLDITVYYYTESCCDYVSVFEGEYTGSASGSGYLRKFQGGNNGGSTLDRFTHESFSVSGDTVTFAFVSDYSVTNYGYYAVVTAEVEAIIDVLTPISGAYAVPSTSFDHVFLGWSEEPDATEPTYLNETDIIANSGYTFMDSPITLYAVYDIYHDVTVNMDENVSAVSFVNANYPVQTVTTSGSTITLRHGTVYIITASVTRSYEVDSWTTTESGVLGDASENPTSYVIIDDDDILEVTTQEAGPLQIIYDGNGLTFEDDATTNVVMYDANMGNVQYATTRYSHTPNVGDDGKRNYSYSNYYSMNNVVTIDGAETLHIRLTWGGESDVYDWVSFWAGNYPSYTAVNNYSTGVMCGDNTTGKYGGGSYTSDSNTVECDIPGDTVTFAFRSDRSGVGDGYGYYAVVMGMDANHDWINIGEPTTQMGSFEKTVVSGEYVVPDSDLLYDFLGWSEDKDAIIPTYSSEEDVINNLNALNGEVFTLYAIYDRYLTLHFDANGGDDGSMPDQIILNRTSANLTAAAFTRTNHTFLWWNTEADGSGTRYYDLASYSASSVALGEVRTLYAQWGELTTISVTLDEHSRSVAVYNSNYPAYEIFNQNNNGDGTHTATIDIYVGIGYTVTATFATGYEFSNWATAENGVFDNANGNPTVYTISGDTALSVVSRIITPPSRCSTPFPGATYMQELAQMDHNEVLNSITTDTQYYLRDARDLKPYCVSKLVDGNLWMTSDLYLGSIYETTTLTSADSDLNGEFVLPIAETSSTRTQWSIQNSTANLDTTHIYNYNTTKNLYNWYTATGGTTYTSHSADTSICPIGWKLFTRANGNSYLLARGVGDYSTSTDILTSSPQYFTYGYYNGYSSGSSSLYAYWTSDGWQDSSSGVYYAYMFGIYNNAMRTSYGYQKYDGLGVRCILASPSYTVNTTMDSHISSIVFTDPNGEEQIATVAEPEVILKQGTMYAVAINVDVGYELASWETSENGTLSSTTDEPTVYSVVGAATLAATSQVKQPLSTCSTPVPGITYMQELDDSNMATVANSMEIGVQYYLRDRRDNTPYCISKIANAIWMTQNLRIVGTVSAEDSNFTGDDVNISTNDFKKNKTNCNNSYNNICSHAADVLDVRATNLTTKQLGTWYNYVAATAGKIAGSSNSNAAATEDICPAGWHMPIYDSNGRVGSINSLTNSYSFYDNFGNVRGGIYYDNKLSSVNFGYWWSNSVYNSNTRYVLYGSPSYNYLLTSNANRYYGFFVRCVKKLIFPIEVSMDSNIESVAFMTGNETQVANHDNPTVYLTYGITYDIAATLKVGSEFTGWSTTEAATLGSETLNPTTYVVTGENTLTVNGRVMCDTPVPNVTYMQDITAGNKSSVMAGMTTEAAYYILDSRDNERYCVSRLADGNLWLIDNLRLNLTDSTVLANVDETNTNADATSLNYLKNGGGTTSDQFATSGVAEWSNDATFASSHSYSDPLVATSGACGNGTTCINMPSTGQWTMDDIVSRASFYGKGSGKVGAYYNYCAASAGSYCYGDGSADYGVSVGDVSQDICPSGWKMPTGGNDGEYSVLRSMYSNDDNRYRAALSLSLTGYFNDGFAYGQGTNGLFSSATRNDDGSMFNVGFSASAINLLDTSSRGYGTSVRCVLESSSYEVTVYMDEYADSVTIIDPLGGTTDVLDGNTIILKQGVAYDVVANNVNGYTVDNWLTSENGIVSYPTAHRTAYVINGVATLTLTSRQYLGPEPPASCNTAVPNYLYLQDITSSNKSAVLNSLTLNYPYYLRDERDGEPYCVSKLADGNLWLLDNLRLDLLDEEVLDSVSEENTNASNTSLSYLKNGGGTTGDRYAIGGVATRPSGGAYSYSRPFIISSGNCAYGSYGYDSGYCANDPGYTQWNKDGTPKYNNVEATTGNGSGKIGIYYNYCAATAGSYCYGSDGSAGSPSGNATEDICPLGWRLPTGSSSGEYRNLCNVIVGGSCSTGNIAMQYGDTNSLSYFLSTPLSGLNAETGSWSQGAVTIIWSSSLSDSVNMYNLTVRRDNYNVVSSFERHREHSIRCILK